MGQCGVLIRNRNPVATAAFMQLAELCRDEFQAAGLLESIPAYDSLVLKFSSPVDLKLLQSRLKRVAEVATAQAAESHSQVAQTHVLSVDFSKGLDWEFATAHTGVGRDDFIEEMCCVEFSVAMLGFLPGFAYLTGLPERLHLPRRPSPRPNVSSGSLSIGGEHCGIYRLPCPGGWQILGEVDLGLSVELDRLLGQFGIGDKVRFVSC